VESYAAGELTPVLLEETIGANFERTVAAAPDAEALVEVLSGRRWTWAELDADVNRLARGLIAAGVHVGDRVGIWAPNCAEWTMVQYAAAKVGAILVNLNPSYRTHEFAYAANQSQVRLLVAASAFKSSDYRAMVDQTRSQCPALERVVYLDTDDWAALVGEGESLPRDVLPERMAGLDAHDAVNIQYTSGTTGRPKGATLSPAPGFDPEATLRAIATERCTGVYGVPTMFIAMQNHPSFAEHDLSTLRGGIMAGSICPVEVMRRCIEDMNMSEIAIAYGMTETSPVSCQTRSDDDLDRRTASIGRVHPHLEIKIVDPVTGATVERGEPGEFCTRGYSVMLGYWSDPEKTAEVIDADGWMHTGDLAEMRDDGYCNIVGRIKDLVIRGGENIYPREVEEFLYAHRDIQDVQVVGVPDPTYGEELCAWVKMRAGATPLDAAAVRAFATGRLSHHKIPRYVIIVEEFPMTVTGKVRKVEMRERSTAELGL